MHNILQMVINGWWSRCTQMSALVSDCPHRLNHDTRSTLILAPFSSVSMLSQVFFFIRTKRVRFTVCILKALLTGWFGGESSCQIWALDSDTYSTVWGLNQLIRFGLCAVLVIQVKFWSLSGGLTLVFVLLYVQLFSDLTNVCKESVTLKVTFGWLDSPRPNKWTSTVCKLWKYAASNYVKFNACT